MTSQQHRPTIADLTSEANPFAQLARSTWLVAKPPKAVLPAVVNNELYDKLAVDNFPYGQLLLLEQLQCLERYLWPCYTDDASNQHVLLLALLINVKRRENLPAWDLLAERPDEFASFFRRVLHMSIDVSLHTRVRTHLLLFIIGAFQSLDSGLVRKECAPLVSIAIWANIHSELAREQIVSKSTQLQKAWRAAGKRYEGADTAGKSRLVFERKWLHTLLLDFLDRLYADHSGDKRSDDRLYCERLLELLCDLQSQLPTRRYVNTLLQDLNLLTAVALSPLYQGEDGVVLREMHQLLVHYTYFPIDDQSGQQLDAQQYEEANNKRIARLQNTALRLHPEKLKILVLANYGSLSQRDGLQGHLDSLSDVEIAQLCAELSIRTQYPERSQVVVDRTFLTEVLVFGMEKKSYFTDMVRKMSTVPTESTLYDKTLLRSERYDGSRPLAMPKLNLQYLTLGDFLWRSFVLYRSEGFYEIRKHLEDTIKRLEPRTQASGVTRFNGFSRMAIPITRPAIIETLPPRVGEEVPAEVRAEIILDVSRLQPGLRKEWESLRPDDVVFLLAAQPAEDLKLTNGHSATASLLTENERIGLKSLRCAEVINVLDENGKILRHDQDTQDHVDGMARVRQRRLLVRLDAAAYKVDQEHASRGDIYDSINVVVRRRARENNFKSVLESMKNLAVSDLPVPTWLQDVFLGFGDPSSANYKRLSNRLTSLDFRDTFLDWQHLVESLPGKTIEPDPTVDASFPPPYVLESTVSEPAPVPRPNKKRKREVEPNLAAPMAETVKVSTYKRPNMGPYPVDAAKVNSIRFTPTQIEAITSGTQPGLTLIVGPPGTGKTDVATQIISNIYHCFPQQRTLLIAHSNQALNQLFAKIAALDIDRRHLLRLGHGEEELTTEGSFSKAGRVESFMENGAKYLAQVQRLADSLGAIGAHGTSCETAAYFNEVFISPLWKRYWTAVDASASEEDIASLFPFHVFFSDAPQPLFPDNASKEALIEVARGCERHIERIFSELADIRPFELLRSQRDKSNYLLISEARVVAMTSTHAAIRRQEIAALGFKYDNVVMEEAAQVTEMESFIPFAMQEAREIKNGAREMPLQRIVLVGDHLQNAPIIQNAAFKDFSNLDQSLFQRLVRLGVPHIMLDAQGRARPSLAALYRWRYPRLTDLAITSSEPQFLQANAGFRYDYQFIDVPDYKGQGEMEPTPHFIQNLGEAEYAVALYQYMRLLGYPAERISILTTYAGQRALIRDVLSHRCKTNRLFGMPGWVGTVDKYQGEQNDYVILSLVRSKNPGYLRDLRRLTVALSRARLGLYVLGRREVFESSLELREAFALMMQRPAKLALVTGEMFTSTSRAVEKDVPTVEMESVEHLGQYVYEMTQAKIQALKGGREVLPPVAQAEIGRVEGEEAEDEDGAAIVEEVDVDVATEY